MRQSSPMRVYSFPSYLYVVEYGVAFDALCTGVDLHCLTKCPG